MIYLYHEPANYRDENQTRPVALSRWWQWTTIEQLRSNMLLHIKIGNKKCRGVKVASSNDYCHHHCTQRQHYFMIIVVIHLQKLWWELKKLCKMLHWFIKIVSTEPPFLIIRLKFDSDSWQSDTRPDLFTLWLFFVHLLPNGFHHINLCGIIDLCYDKVFGGRLIFHIVKIFKRYNLSFSCQCWRRH